MTRRPRPDVDERGVSGGLVASPHALAGVLAGAAVLASAWPIDLLFTSAPWRAPAVVQVLLVAGLGILLRTWGRGSGPVASIQFGAVLLAQSVLFPGPDPLLGGLIPTPGTVGAWRDLVAEAVANVMTHAAPAPAPPGVAFALTGFVALVAWAVDVVAVSSRMPAVAGLPLLTPLLTAIANSSASLPLRYLLPPLALWVALLAEQERDWLILWRPDLAARAVVPGRGRRTVGALLVGALAVGVAAVGGSALPHLPQRYLLQGLGTGDSAGGNRVGFSPSPDMLTDLTSTNNTTVISYTTTDSLLPPLRVSLADQYVDGRWYPLTVGEPPTNRPRIPYPAGLAKLVRITEPKVSVLETGLAAPYLAAPAPLSGGTVIGANWAVDQTTGVPVVDRTPRSYELTYYSPEPTAEQLLSGPPARENFLPQLDVPTWVSTPLFLDTLRRVTAEAPTPYEKAVKIQAWLRTEGGFTYSLVLPPPPAGMSSRQAARTAVDRFLTTKTGYCVQFATTMVLMARQVGIPARLANGFLPGTLQDDTRRVRASDAHAWPELYFEGIGWLRFEPTPQSRSGPAPAYSTGLGAKPTVTVTATPTTQLPTSAAPTTAPRERPDVAEGDLGRAADDAPWWRLPLQVLLMTLVLVLFLPVLARLRMARRRARAPDEDARAEVEWQAVRWGLEDLGLTVPEAATPRQMRTRLTYLAALDREEDRALGRILAAVERARYAPPRVTVGASVTAARGGASPGPSTPAVSPSRDGGTDLAADVRLVLRGAAQLRPRWTRIRAKLLPRAGWTVFRRFVRKTPVANPETRETR